MLPNQEDADIVMLLVMLVLDPYLQIVPLVILDGSSGLLLLVEDLDVLSQLNVLPPTITTMVLVNPVPPTIPPTLGVSVNPMVDLEVELELPRLPLIVLLDSGSMLLPSNADYVTITVMLVLDPPIMIVLPVGPDGSHTQLVLESSTVTSPTLVPPLPSPSTMDNVLPVPPVLLETLIPMFVFPPL